MQAEKLDSVHVTLLELNKHRWPLLLQKLAKWVRDGILTDSKTFGLHLWGHVCSHPCPSSQSRVLGSGCVTDCWITPDRIWLWSTHASNSPVAWLLPSPKLRGQLRKFMGFATSMAQEGPEGLQGCCSLPCQQNFRPGGVCGAGRWGAVYNLEFGGGNGEPSVPLCSQTTIHTERLWKNSTRRISQPGKMVIYMAKNNNQKRKAKGMRKQPQT